MKRANAVTTLTALDHFLLGESCRAGSLSQGSGLGLGAEAPDRKLLAEVQGDQCAEAGDFDILADDAIERPFEGRRFQCSGGFRRRPPFRDQFRQTSRIPAAITN